MIPEDVMQSVAYQAQPDWAKAVLFAVACRYNGHQNGNLSLPFRDAKELGISAQWKLYAGIRLLTLVGLIRLTRKGSVKSGRKFPNLYALDWRGIDSVDGLHYDAGIMPSPTPRHYWARWERPKDWGDTVKKVRRANHGRSKLQNSST